MIRIDLHTHSYGSPDGGITLAGYRKILTKKIVDYIAVTDHNSIVAAKAIKKVLGDRIVIGEEIMTTGGEIIGLYLKREVPAGLSPKEAVARIKEQSGLVLIPHPFETIRKGISERTLATIIKDVDLIELRNGRAVFQNRSLDAQAWAKLHNIQGVACSDAHSFRGVGRTHTSIPHKPTKSSLVGLLGSAEHSTRRARLPSLLAPKLNRLRKKTTRMDKRS